MSDKCDSCVLVTVAGELKTLDFGSGVVLGHVTGSSGKFVTYVLTCAHNLRSRRPKPDGTSDSKLFVNGVLAQLINDKDRLQTYDLAILTVDEKLGLPVKWDSKPGGAAKCSAFGFVGFYRQEYRLRAVSAPTPTHFVTYSGNGRKIEYLAFMPPSGKKALTADEWFAKGMSGGPVFRGNGIVAIARMHDVVRESEDSSERKLRELPQAYAIELTPAVLNAVNQVTGQNFGTGLSVDRTQSFRSSDDDNKPPTLDAPDPISVGNDDLQKGRFGGEAQKGPYRVSIENVRLFKRYFVFDAAVTSATGDLIGPFVFYLHDSFNPSVIWVRKTDAKRAVLSDIGSNGVFTLGVQFRVDAAADRWKRLEFDLADYTGINLSKYTK